MSYHKPVLLTEAVQALKIDPAGIYVDATFGGGGHSHAILECLSRAGRLIAFDQDEDSRQNMSRFENCANFQFIKANFRYLQQYLDYHGIEKIDGILIDLGLSSHQIDSGERGFSLKYDGVLDMRMSKTIKRSAQDLINTYSEYNLIRILKDYGEIRQAHKLAETILKQRQPKPIKTTFELVELIRTAYSKNASFRLLAQVFQAFRIEVNQELEALKTVLTLLPNILKVNARAVIISYHSLEDRLVKFFFKTGNFQGTLQKDKYGNILRPLKPIHMRAIQASKAEIKANKRARSAKLRTAVNLEKTI